MDRTLLVVGWDAATTEHLDAFDLPFYEQLTEGGVLQPEPFWQNREVDSGTAWTTITTGLSMWDHRVATLSGMIDAPWKLRTLSKVDRLIPRDVLNTPARIWFRRLALGSQPTNDDIPYKRAWHHVPNSLGAFVPLTYPPKPTDGVTISGFPSPEVAVEPTDIEDSVRQRYDGEPERKFDEDGGVREGYIDDLYEAHTQQVETVRWLTDNQDFNLVFAVFTLLDRLLHVTDEGDSRIQEAYEKMDSTTASLVDDIDPDDVLIISDHGMTYNPRWKWRHIHDETSGIWAGTTDFGIETHLDVTPTILSYFDIEMNKTKYQNPRTDRETRGMEEKLEDLGYL
ncbi:alkaline phosphatase family protein [Haloarcula sp. S1CR25-12]|uniref:Alkaline phosphatase family protein n=1 Tax=Haloarcula saliterrae TaxID=2950534 RepID=A0ABU2FC51_9EURY|nr:alkaline phosphatase family protein [Haloarcula sp. S1CR25-12]MDS0259777.1 alkaline phosphatase family protein [Haloarcula sp. S1CR25-12]